MRWILNLGRHPVLAPSRSAEENVRWLRIIALAVLLLIGAMPTGTALLVWSGSDTVRGRSTAPGGELEARIFDHGGAMQYPITTLAVRTRGGWFDSNRQSCAVLRCWANPRLVNGVRSVAANYQPTMRWGDGHKLLLSDPAARLGLLVRACGVVVLADDKENG